MGKEIKCCCSVAVGGCERVIKVTANTVLANQISIEIDGVDANGENMYSYISLDEDSMRHLIREMEIEMEIAKRKPKIIDLDKIKRDGRY